MSRMPNAPARVVRNSFFMFVSPEGQTRVSFQGYLSSRRIDIRKYCRLGGDPTMTITAPLPHSFTQMPCSRRNIPFALEASSFAAHTPALGIKAQGAGILLLS